MRRVAFAILVLLMTFSTGAAVKVIAIKHVAAGGGGGNLLDETFNGAGYVDGDWTEVSGTIDEDSATCGSGVGWNPGTVECLRITGGTFDDPRLTNVFAAQSGDLYLTFSMKLTYTIDDDGERWGVVALDGAVPETAGPRISIKRTVGPVYELLLYAGNTGLLDSYAFASGSQICLQLMTNAATDDWEWRIGDGTTQNVEGSGIGTGAFTVDPTTLHLGTVTIQGGNSMDLSVDSVKVGNEGWIGCS